MSDAAILKYASSRIRLEGQSDKDETNNRRLEKSSKVSGDVSNSGRPRVESLSESDDLVGHEAQKSRTQRRKKKGERPTVNRIDSLSESEEVQRQRGMPKSGRREKKDGGMSSRTEKSSGRI